MSHEIGNYTPTGFIRLGTTVELIVNSIDGIQKTLPKNKFVFKLVQHDTSDALKRLVAIDSHVGAAILGRPAGDIVVVEAPGGKINYKIERIY
jgi:transcription elongation GreA/GreB family factor